MTLTENGLEEAGVFSVVFAINTEAYTPTQYAESCRGADPFIENDKREE